MLYITCYHLTIIVCKGTEWSPGAIASLLYIITLSWLIYLMMIRCCFNNWYIYYSTSGWNCCSVLVWQYGQESPRSQWAGSLHSSFNFTLGHGVDLCGTSNRWGVRMTHRQPVSNSPIIKSFRSSSTIFSIMVVGAGVTLPTKSRWSFTWFSFIISQYKAVICIVTISLTLLHVWCVTIISIIKHHSAMTVLCTRQEHWMPSQLTTSIIHNL